MTTLENELMNGAAQVPEVQPTPPASPDQAAAANQRYWYELINERAGGEFLGLTDRTMQAYRQRGRGPPFVRISSRCIRYRRFDLKAWAEARMRSSTSDIGEVA